VPFPVSTRYLCVYKGKLSGIRCTAPAVVGDSRCERHYGKPNGQAARARARDSRRLSGQALAILAEQGVDWENERELMDILEHPREVDPGQLLLEEVSRCAGVVAWLEARISALAEDDSEGAEGFISTVETYTREEGTRATATGSGSVDVETTERRKEVSHWWRILQEERKLLQSACTAALKSNIEERRVRLAERSVNSLESAMAMALLDLGLDPHNERVRSIVGTRLRAALEAGDASPISFMSAKVPEKSREPLIIEGTVSAPRAPFSPTKDTPGPSPVDF
jgi:hypothetical protein